MAAKLSAGKLLELTSALTDLAWSVWSELGVPGVHRVHQQVAVDLEPLVALSPLLFPMDPRLRDQVYGWCVNHHGRVSVSRLRALVGRLTPAATTAYRAFSASLSEFEGIRWPDPAPTPWPHQPEVREIRLPTMRPALVRLRARAVCGVGARADILCDLLGREPGWVPASEIGVALGFTGRQTRQVLNDLQEAGAVEARHEGHGRVFRLTNVSEWRRILGADSVFFPRWELITTLVLRSVDLLQLADGSPAVQRVTANNHREELAEIASRIGLPRPPVTTGNPDAYGATLGWLTAEFTRMGDGTSPAFGGS